MTTLANVTAALAKNLHADSTAERTGGAAVPPAAFAGLLDAQQQRFAASGASTAYNGSAFDVAPAQRPAERASITATPPKPPTREAQPGPKPSAERAPQRSAPTPPAAPAQAPAKSTQAARPAERERDDGPPGSTDAAAPDGAATDTAAAPEAAAAVDVQTADGPPVDGRQPDAQSLLDWMTRWSAPVTAEPAGAAAAHGLAGAAGEAPGLAGPAVAGAASPDRDTAGRAHALVESAELAVAASADGETAPREPGTEGAAALKHGDPALAPLPGLGAPVAAQPLAGTSASLTVALAVALPTPVDSPDFSQALASQLTTFARDGVHEAQLQLNPADMGPISVQITLDGAQAQIDFSAQHARTRDALEAAWPALAASLHSAGMTLGGGGVFEQRPGPRDGEAGSGNGRASVAGAQDADEAAGTSARTVRIDTQRGLLDLYA